MIKLRECNHYLKTVLICKSHFEITNFLKYLFSKLFDNRFEMSNEEEEEELTDDTEEIPMEDEDSTSYFECFKKYWRRDLNWNSAQIKKLLFIFRVICSIILGSIFGFVRIPILFSMIIFVFILSVEIPKIISFQLKFDIFTLFDSPIPVMRENLFFIYVLFTSIWIAGDMSSHKFFDKKPQ